MPNSERSSGRRFDKEHGVTTHAVMLLSQLDDDRSGEAYAHATHYEAVPVADLRKMLACVPDAFVRDATFVDVGAGMGRAILIASEYPFKQILGIELSPALFEIARENVARAHDLRTLCRDVRLTRGDARKRRFPSGNLVMFLFNPFDAAALRTTLERVRCVASRGRRGLRAVSHGRASRHASRVRRRTGRRFFVRRHLPARRRESNDAVIGKWRSRRMMRLYVSAAPAVVRRNSATRTRSF